MTTPGYAYAAADPSRAEHLVGNLALFTGILTVDRVTKVLVPYFLDLHQSIPVIPSVFNLTYVLNTGGAFGIMAGWDSPLRRIFFITASIVALGLLIHLYRHAGKSPHRSIRLSLAVITAGAMGNLYDRMMTGEVVDFLDFYVGSYHWPAFNVADSAITLGAGYLLYLYVTGRVDFPENGG